MAKESSLTLRICDGIVTYSMYVLVFLLPILFLPWSSDVLDFNKQAILVGLSFLALFAWMAKILISGSFSLNINKMHIAVGVLFLVYLASTVFSVYRYGSLWGWPSSTAESLLSAIGLVIVYFLVSNTFGKKEILTSIILLLAAGLIAALYGVLQLFGFYIIPFNFAKNLAFNSIGQVGSFGLFLALLLPLSMVLLITSKKWIRALCALNVLLAFIAFIIINYKFIWWIVLAGSALVMLLGTLKRNLFSGRWMFLPMFFLVVSLFFIVLSPRIAWLPQVPGEVYVSQKSNLDIDWKALKENAMVGSGPGTFGYNFAKFKDKIFNSGSLWNISFTVGASKVLTSLATTGILGVLAWLAIMAGIAFYGFKNFIFTASVQGSENPELQKEKASLVLGILTALVIESAAFFLYNSNLTLDFLYFLFIGMLVALIFNNSKTYTLEPSSLLTLAVTFVFTLVFIFGLGFLLLDGQRYVADMHYARGVALLRAGNLEGGLQKFEAAASMNSGLDLYFNQLSQLYLLNIKQLLENNEISADERAKKVQGLISNSLNASKIATDLAPKNVSNWIIRGSIYQNLMSLLPDAKDWAIKSYDEAIALDPYNPYLLLQEGVVYYQGKDYKNAQIVLEKAMDLKADYSDVLYFLGLTYDQLGDKNKARDTFTKLLAIVPQNQAQDVQKILDNLKAGRAALAGFGQEAPVATSEPPTTLPTASPTPSPSPTLKTP